MGKFLKCDESKRTFESAIRTYGDEKGNEVSLVSCVHLGEKEYFDSIVEKAGRNDVVLYEGVGSREEKEAVKEGPGWMKALNDFALNMFESVSGLRYQTKTIDYGHLPSNWEHCDVSMEEMSRHMFNPEEMMKMFGKAGMGTKERELGEKLKGKGFGSFKEMLALSLNAAMEDGTTPYDDMFIVKGRNEVIKKRVKEKLASDDSQKIAVFYGAGHMPDIEKYLTADLGFKEKGEEWVTAFKY